MWVFIGIILMLIAEFAPPPPRRSQNTKIQKPKRSYKSSDYTIDSTSFHVVESDDCGVSFNDDINMMIQSEKPLDIEKLEKLIDKVIDSDGGGKEFDPSYSTKAEIKRLNEEEEDDDDYIKKFEDFLYGGD